MQEHEWVYDDVIENGISDCYRCKICGLAQLIYENDKYLYNLKSIVKMLDCNKNNNRGIYIASMDLDMAEKKFMIVSHEDTA